ncbi:EAL domain-containing protein [Aliivibrio fischeri]|uniref:EAL domain-containing protein n=1 Tax=Aliivibrio fischeri TaxID=668 RepID=UPI0012DAD1E9|nr:EAL domain-containing protein [Aliivibrio fischeri]MUJ25671.1 EAL domain-containing protein [Aliivibrio fischeri]
MKYLTNEKNKFTTPAFSLSTSIQPLTLIIILLLSLTHNNAFSKEYISEFYYTNDTDIDTLNDAISFTHWKINSSKKELTNNVWLKIKVPKSNSFSEKEELLKYNDAYINYIDFWHTNDNGSVIYNHTKGGDNRVSTFHEDFSSYYYCISIKRRFDSSGWVYIKLKSSLPLNTIPLLFLSKHEIKSEFHQQSFLGAGILGAIFLCILISCCMTRRKNMLSAVTYSMLLINIAIATLYRFGFISYHFTANYPVINKYIHIINIPLGIITSIIFAICSCNLSPPSKRNLKVVIFSYLSLTLISSFYSNSMLLSTELLLGTAATLYLVCICLKEGISGNNKALWFFGSWFIFTLVNAIANLQIMGLISFKQIGLSIHQFEMLYAISPMLSICIISMLHARSINDTINQRNRMQAELSNQLTLYKDLYDNSKEGLCTMSLNGHIIQQNTAFEHITTQKPMLLEYLSQSIINQAWDEKRTNLYNGIKEELQFQGLYLKYYIQQSQTTHHLEVTLEDITQEATHREHLEYLATTDSTTELYNRRYLTKQLNQLLKEGVSHNALLFLDLDHFKLLNDIAGHSAGDELLKQIAQQLNACKCTLSSAKITIARMGGDEFCVLMPLASKSEAEDLAHCILARLAELKVSHSGQIFDVSASIGIVLFDAKNTKESDIMSISDHACYSAKDRGRNGFYTIDMNQSDVLTFRSDMLDSVRLKNAINNQKIHLFCQQILKVSEPKNIYLEILARLENEQGKLISPFHFISTAERYQLMPDIDLYMVNQFLNFSKNNPSFVSAVTMVGINLSGQSLIDKSFRQRLLLILKQQKCIPASKLCFEITETIAITNLRDVANFLVQLKQLGVNISIDDFGSGYANYHYLRNLPFDSLKVDGDIIKSLKDDEIGETWVMSMIEIAQKLNVPVVGEFISDQILYDRCIELGFDYLQGFYIHEPEHLSEYNFTLQKKRMIRA